MMRRSASVTVTTFSGISVNGTSVAPSAMAGIAQSGTPSRLNPATASVPFNSSRRMLSVVMSVTLYLSFFRRQPQESRPRKHIDRAVRALSHFTNALLEIGQQLFLGDDALAAHHEANQVLASHRADEQVALPFREEIARVEHHAGRRDRRHPEIDRLFHALHRRLAVADGHVLAPICLPCVVLPSVGDIWPAVVLARADDVHLVAALRPMIDGPQLSGLGVNRGAFRILEAMGIGFREDRRTVEPRVVFGNRTVPVDA